MNLFTRCGSLRGLIEAVTEKSTSQQHSSDEDEKSGRETKKDVPCRRKREQSQPLEARDGHLLHTCERPLVRVTGRTPRRDGRGPIVPRG